MPLPRLVSPDDHVLTPPNVWTERLPAKYRDVGPRVVRSKGRAALTEGWIDFVESDDGDVCDVWCYEDIRRPTLRATAAAGLPKKEVDARPVTFDSMRKGFYDPQARLVDMDTAGVEASVCYPNMFVRFCGQTFLNRKDKELALLCVQAYNDFIADEWCAQSGGRLVPMGIVPLWDAELAVQEVQRVAALGFRGLTFSEAPHLLGLPSVFSGYWEPFFAACAEAELVLSLHVGSGGSPMIAKDAPAALSAVTPAMNSTHALLDLLFSGVFGRHPALKVCLAESQIGWIPFFLQRADTVWEELRSVIGVSAEDMPNPPSFYFRQNVWCTFFNDAVGLQMLDLIGPEKVLYETDYPHADTSWPNSHEVATALTSSLPADTAAMIVAGNARSLYRIDVQEPA